jgi:hypothetical protein
MTIIGSVDTNGTPRATVMCEGIPVITFEHNGSSCDGLDWEGRYLAEMDGAAYSQHVQVTAALACHLGLTSVEAYETWVNSDGSSEPLASLLTEHTQGYEWAELMEEVHAAMHQAFPGDVSVPSD